MTSRRNTSIEEFLESLDHPRIADIRAIREVILGIRPDVTEKIKWNAPSFGIDGDDRVTFRLRPGDIVQLMFHRGAKPKVTEGFEFADPSGLLSWQATDRAVLKFGEPDGVAVANPVWPELVNRWLSVTRD